MSSVAMRNPRIRDTGRRSRTHAASDALIAALQREFEKRADPARAPQMQAYMKSAMPYYGIAAPDQRRVCREVFAAHPLDGFDAWRDTVLALWRGARFREERYAAIDLTGDGRYRTHQTLATLPMYEEIVVTGAWWDYIDAIAINRLGPLLRKYPRPMKQEMRRWSRSGDLWKRRASIICQNNLKAETDLPLLYACIEPNLGDRDFFIRKAIGWALRAYAWTDAAEVLRYVRAHEPELSALSRREALKNVPQRD